MSMSQAWEHLPLSKPVMTAVLKRLKYRTMTPVQAACIPQFMNYKDVAVEAVTGSGKTVAFLVPLLEILLRTVTEVRREDVYAVVISPTRELATQICEVLGALLLEAPQFSRLLVTGGGRPPAEDARLLAERGASIIVATPGRLHDLLQRPQTGRRLQAALRALEVLVLDEADRLLDLGFERQLNDILGWLPRQRRTGLFSATQTDEVQKLVRAGLRNPVAITVRDRQAGESRTPHQLQNFYTVCEAHQKVATLIHILRQRLLRPHKIMVFFATCAMVEYFAVVIRRLVDSSNVLSIHGKMKNKRFKIFDKFRKMEEGVLLCTDVMARGVDIPSVHLVVQFDPPGSAAAFVHRCGRTARSGRGGAALLLLLPSETSYVQFLQLNQQVTLWEQPPPAELPELSQLTAELRQLQTADRANYDRATRAFVSLVQAYAKHECRLIFNVKDLPLGGLATALGLLQLPRMPELRGVTVTDFTPADTDLNSLPYRNAEREAARQAKLVSYRETGAWPGARPTPARPWSQAKARRQQQKEKKQQRRQLKQPSTQKKRARQVDPDEWDELATEARALKKLKKGKMTKRQFDASIGMED